MCGGFDHAIYHHGPFVGKEVDLNSHLQPAKPFCDLLDLPATVRPRLRQFKPCENPASQCEDGDCANACAHEGFCPEAEISPHARFRHEDPDLGNRWFYWDEGSALEDRIADGRGETACAYGPWVVEQAHKDRPEIHPT